MSDYDKILASIKGDEEKIRTLTKRIKESKSRLEKVKAMEIEMLLNELDCNAIDTTAFLKALKTGDIYRLRALSNQQIAT